MIDEREIAELRAKMATFENVFVDLAQAVNRIVQIHEIERRGKRCSYKLCVLPQGHPGSHETAPIPSPTTILPGYTGDACRDCGSLKLLRTGTCVTCQDCGRNEGCT